MPNIQAALCYQCCAVEWLDGRLVAKGGEIGGFDEAGTSLENLHRGAYAFLRLFPGVLESGKRGTIDLVGRLPLNAGSVVPLHGECFERLACLPVVISNDCHCALRR